MDLSAKDFKLATDNGLESCIYKQIPTTQSQSQNNDIESIKHKHEMRE
jgi:hypothetical protein